MKTVQAVRIHTYGGPEVLKYEEAPLPKPGPGEALVRVHAAGVNPVDWKIREGYFKGRANHSLPLILGWDLSGVVEVTGSGVEGLKRDDEVYSRPHIARDGAYAEYIVVRETEVALKPKSIDHVPAAAIPLASLTAWQSLFDSARLSAGQKVLIHAAAGGVGSFAVQLAKWKGAYVIGTASNRNQDFVRKLGADETLDYQTTRFEDVVHDVDVVFDTIGGDTQKRSWKVLKKGGILVSIVGPPSTEEAAAHGVHQASVFVYEIAQKRSDAEFELVDIKDFNLPLLDEPMSPIMGQYSHQHTKTWSAKIASFDAYVFVTPEYNHATSGALKNAIDFLYHEWVNKAAGFVGYGGASGTRAVENLRLVMGELQVADVKAQVGLSLFTDFEDFSVFKPAPQQEKSVNAMLDQVIAWGGALKPLREKRA